MARYFFHVLNGRADIDTDGVECADMPAVREEAIKSAGQMLSTGVHSWSGDAWQMIVADTDENIVFSARFTVDHHGF